MARMIIGFHGGLTPIRDSLSLLQVDHVKEPKNWELVEKAQFCYSAGFFITVSPESIKAVSRHCCENNKVYIMNISAPFICQVPPFKACLMDTMPYIDFLFGNENEFTEFAKSEGWDHEDLKKVALKTAALPKASGNRCRTVIITQGCDPTIIARDGLVKEYPVEKVSKSSIVDTNGAGDAFVGGFITGLLKNREIEECCRSGNYAASRVIQQSGCTLPEKCEFAFSA